MTLDWTAEDELAVDTVRVLAMDAVQKVGNGHPGTAMSLAPAAYLLFQKVMRHDPADPHWPGRDRFVLSAGHSSLTLYLQLYLGGCGLELDDIKALRTWGSKTPGHPEYGHTAGVETTTGPLGQGIGNAVGMAMAAPPRARHARSRRARDSPFDHQIYAIAATATWRRASAPRRRRSPGRQGLGNLTVIYDANQICIEDDTDIALQRGRRRPLRGLRLARPGRRLDQRRRHYREDVQALYDALRGGSRRHRPAVFIELRTIIAWPAPERAEHRQGARLGPRRRRGRGDQEGARLRPRRRPSRCRPASSSTPASSVERGAAAGAEWDKKFEKWPTRTLTVSRTLMRLKDRSLPDGWADKLPDLRCRRQGRGHPQGLQQGDQRDRRHRPGVLGRLGGPRRVEQHHDRRARRRSLRRRGRPRCGRPTPRPAGCCTSASASTRWARS